MATKAQQQQDRRWAKIAAGEGMVGAYTALSRARMTGIGPALALGLRHQETGVKGNGNVFGHDPTIFIGAGKVTKEKYLDYREQRGPKGHGGQQGVGPLQLTYFSFQDEADRLGGCWMPRHNYYVGYNDLAHLIRALNSVPHALAVYNGGFARPNWSYAHSVEEHRRYWQKKLDLPGH